MAWLSRVNFIASDTLSFSDINNLGNDIRAWGGNVNGGGYVLSNVVLSASAGTMATVTGGTGAASTLTIQSTSGAGSSDALIFKTASQSERMRILTTGEVGIGTASPAAKLHTLGLTDAILLKVEQQKNDGGSTDMVLLRDDRGFSGINSGTSLHIQSWSTGNDTGDIFLTERFTGSSFYPLRVKIDGTVIMNDGSVGIGTTSPTNKLSISGYTSATTQGSQGIEVYSDANHRTYLTQNSAGGSQSAFLSHGARWFNSTGTYTSQKTTASFGSSAILLDNENFAGIKFLWKAGGATVDDGAVSTLATILSSGNVGIGVTNPAYKIELSTDSAGKPGISGLWTVTSDERIKTDITPADLDRCYEIVKSVPLKHFGFAPGVYTDDQINDKHSLGWIAQDVQKVFSKAVSVKPFTLKIAIPDGAEEYTEQDFTLETVEKTETSIQVIDGKPVQVSKVVTSENKVLLFDSVDVVDEAGAVVMDGDKALTYQMPRMVTKTRNKVRHDVIEDCLDLNGGQMIAALYGAVQALMLQVESLKAGN